MSIWSLSCAGALFGAWLAVGIAPAAGQAPAFPGSLTRLPDPIERARALSTAPRPSVGAAPEPARRWVPERRVTVPGTARQIVVPGHFERRLSNTQVVVPTLPVYGAGPGEPLHIYRHEAPPAEIRRHEAPPAEIRQGP